MDFKKQRVSRMGVACGVLAGVALMGSAAVAQVKIGNQVPLSLVERVTVRGSFVAAGGGARNFGETDIDVNLPSDAIIKAAYLYWGVMRDTDDPLPTMVRLNGKKVYGTVVATSGDACWPELKNPPDFDFDVFRADVTDEMRPGTNRVRNIPSGLDDGTPPSQTTPQDATVAFPLADGASLFVIFEHPKYDCNEVALYDGAQTFGAGALIETLDEFTVAPGGGDSWFSFRNNNNNDDDDDGKHGKGGKNSLNPEDAKTVYIIGDGQARFSGKEALFDGMVVVPNDAFPGADGSTPANCDGSVNNPDCDGLWDTLNVDVSDKFVPGVPKVVEVGVNAGFTDCVTWVAQGLAVKTKRLSHESGGNHSDDDDDNFFSKSGQAATAAASGAGGMGGPAAASADNTWGWGGSNKGGGHKVDVCHVPPGNPANAHTINIDRSAVSAHLNNHGGDYLGECSLSRVCNCDSSSGNKHDDDDDHFFSRFGSGGNHDDDDDGGPKNDDGCAGNNGGGGSKHDDDDDHR